MRTILTSLLMLTTLTVTYGRRLPTIKRIAQPPTELFDTIDAPRADAVRFSGFEKTNPSTRETFFITNSLGADSTIVAVEFTLTYFDTDGNQLHERTETIRCLLPPGETRAASLPSWDANHAFHYHLSTPPARRRSSPFSVRSRLRKIILTFPQIH